WGKSAVEEGTRLWARPSHEFAFAVRRRIRASRFADSGARDSMIEWAAFVPLIRVEVLMISSKWGFAAVGLLVIGCGSSAKSRVENAGGGGDNVLDGPAAGPSSTTSSSGVGGGGSGGATATVTTSTGSTSATSSASSGPGPGAGGGNSGQTCATGD